VTPGRRFLIFLKKACKEVFARMTRVIRPLNQMLAHLRDVHQKYLFWEFMLIAVGRIQLINFYAPMLAS